jgi:hypothetical protein
VANSSKPVKVTLEKPTKDLRALGEKLQQEIAYTRNRIPGIKLHPLKLVTLRTLDRAERMFYTIGQNVQMVDSMRKFLEINCGCNVDALFAFAGEGEQAARISTHSVMVMVNKGIELVLDDLRKVNLMLDKENDHGK